MSKGWRNESHRHSLSAKGIKTNPKERFVACGRGLEFERVEGVFEGDRTLRVVGVVDGRDVGYVEVTYDLGEGDMSLDVLYVEEDLRRMGYANLLMNEALDFADEQRLVTDILVEPIGAKWDELAMTDYPLWLAEKERLRDYYNKFGFISTKRNAMVRLPET